jgi:phosphoribosylanthranilate isomerase
VSHSAVRVKICGLTCVEDAVVCAELGADWIGLNFHPPSPRCVSPTLAAKIVAAVPDSVAAVGVFVDRHPAEVVAIARDVGLRIVQLHGEEPPEDVLALDCLRVIRAFRLESAAAWLRVTQYLRRVEELGRRLEGVLVDAFVAGQRGGTGASIGEEILEDRPPLPHLILAGGLTPANVAERIARFRPWMVDVASGVESVPGRKDGAAVAAFLRAARGRLDPTADGRPDEASNSPGA